MHYQQMREWQGQTMPRGTNSRRLGVLDSPLSPITLDQKWEQDNISREDHEERMIQTIHEFYRDAYYVFKHEDSLT